MDSRVFVLHLLFFKHSLMSTDQSFSLSIGKKILKERKLMIQPRILFTSSNNPLAGCLVSFTILFRFIGSLSITGLKIVCSARDGACNSAILCLKVSIAKPIRSSMKLSKLMSLGGNSTNNSSA